MMRKWVGRKYTGREYRTKSDASKNILLGQRPVRVQKRFENCWIVVGGDDGITTVTTPDGRALIGYDDRNYDGTDQDFLSFRKALIERQIEFVRDIYVNNQQPRPGA